MPKVVAAAIEVADIVKETLYPYRNAMAEASSKLECLRIIWKNARRLCQLLKDLLMKYEKSSQENARRFHCLW